MFPHGLTCAVSVAAYRTSDVIKTATIAWTRVHVIIKSITCAKVRLKWRGSDDLPRTTWQPEDLPIGIESKGLRCIRRPRLFAITICGSPSDGAETSWKNFAIEPWSRRDRAAIAQISSRNRSDRIRRRPTDLQDHDRRTIVARSRRDRGAIVAKIGGFFIMKSGQNRRGIEAASSPSGTAPTTLANRLHGRSNDPGSSDQFPSLKACIPLLLMNFWSIREGIKQISRKIFISSWSPCV